MKNVVFVVVLAVVGCASQPPKSSGPESSAALYASPVDPFTALESTANDGIAPLRYSNTQKEFGADLQAYLAEKGPRFVQPKSIQLAPPPANHSPRTRAELDFLLHLQKIRTADDVATVHAQDKFVNLLFGKTTVSILKGHPAKDADAVEIAFSAAMRDFMFSMMQKKRDFDRVRSMYLDPEIKPVITMPPHPAYPSGHAGQSKLIANLLSQLSLADEAAFQESALKIGLNREIAGVHYPSDTAIGRELADKFQAEIFKNAQFKKLFEKAKKAWKTQDRVIRIWIGV